MNTFRLTSWLLLAARLLKFLRYKFPQKALHDLSFLLCMRGELYVYVVVGVRICHQFRFWDFQRPRFRNEVCLCAL